MTSVHKILQFGENTKQNALVEALNKKGLCKRNKDVSNIFDFK